MEPIQAVTPGPLQVDIAIADQLDDDGRRLVVRNGYHRPRDVVTAAGAVTVVAPRVNDKRIDPDSGQRHRFSSAILPAWARKSPQVTEVLPQERHHHRGR